MFVKFVSVYKNYVLMILIKYSAMLAIFVNLFFVKTNCIFIGRVCELTFYSTPKNNILALLSLKSIFTIALPLASYFTCTPSVCQLVFATLFFVM